MKNLESRAVPLISETEQKILELLLTGASSKSIAAQLGYKDGTTRVYLHALYKRIGVNNKTSAVTWYLDAKREILSGPQPVELDSSIETFGDRAWRTDLSGALGIMEVFLGPHGRMWDTMMRLGGDGSGVETPPHVRERSRQLWNAFLRGDFTEAARRYDREGIATLFIESPSDAVVLAASLRLGGFTARAGKAVGSLRVKRGGSIGITQDEKIALAAMADVVEGERGDEGLAALHRLADRSLQRPVFRHLLIVALFHAYKMRNDEARGRDTGNAIWAEAEAAKQHLQSMGDATFPAESKLPVAPKLAKAELTSYLARIAD